MCNETTSWQTLDKLWIIAKTYLLSGETLRTIFMGVATSVAVFSSWNTIRLWHKTNRPIVSAFVETVSSGNVSTSYNLLVINSGNRPAVNIRLKLKMSTEDFQKCINSGIDASKVEWLQKCFSSEA